MRNGPTVVTGVPGVINGMKAVKKGLEGELRLGLIRAGLFIQRESMLIVPVDTANLKNSAFTRARGFGALTVVTVGYTAAYAVYVHEDENATHKAGKENKFLESVVRNKRKIILGIIKGAME